MFSFTKEFHLGIFGDQELEIFYSHQSADNDVGQSELFEIENVNLIDTAADLTICGFTYSDNDMLIDACKTHYYSLDNSEDEI